VLAPDFLAVDCVSKSYARGHGERLAVLDKLSFGFAEQHLGVMLGPSGCGKSTLLRLVAGLETPTSGEIRIDGARIIGPGRHRGMVFQSYTSFPWLNVRANVEYGLKLHGESLAIAEDTAEHFLNRVRSREFADAYPEQLSGGMRQRVALARALATIRARC